MASLLDRIYRRLPVVREIKYLSRKVEPQLQALLRLHQEEHITGLLQSQRYANPKRLNRYEYQVFSQNGEDGIIAEIFRRIGASAKTFVEVGVGDGLQTNTAFLLTDGWSGCWIDGGKSEIEATKINFGRAIAEGFLKVARAIVTAENADDLVFGIHGSGEVDLLSLDVDRNTYWIWAALSSLRARAVVVEYNSHYPADVDWKVEYDASGWWNETTYFGASLKAYEVLGRRLGYSLVGCDLTGTNAFFVRSDLCEDRFVEPFDAESHYEPPRHYLVRRAGFPPCYTDVKNHTAKRDADKVGS